MIFITIGTQEPFDRLVKVMDELAGELSNIPFVAQVSKSELIVRNMQSVDFISPFEFNNYFQKASLIVSHAGMGTIISALELQKPIIVLPRQSKLGEHRSDHQIATARKFDKLGYIHVAYEEQELKTKVISLLKSDLKPLYSLSSYASPELIHSIHTYINS
jgi:UDP-N-acetylglucosamine transferase subunit ALG13